MFNIPRLLARLRQDEGFRSAAYLCPAGVWTIGYGATEIRGEPVTANTPSISIAEAKVILKADLLEAIEDAIAIYEDVFALLPDVRQEVLICLAYQLGRGGLSRFTEMNKAIRAGDIEGWLRELKDSQMYRRYTRRVEKYLQSIVDRRWPE